MLKFIALRPALRHSATKFGADNTRSHRYVERLGALTLWGIGWYEQLVGEAFSALGAHALALVAHHYHARWLQLCGVDVVAIKHSAVNRCSLLG